MIKRNRYTYPFLCVSFFVIAFFFIQKEAKAQKFVAAEYFIDIDQGAGNGIALPITDIEDENLEEQFEITLPDGLSAGPHSIGIRVKDSLGRWSLNKSQVFYLTPPINPQIPAQKKVIAYEFFFDADPGVGLGQKVTLPSAVVDTEVSIALDVTSLGVGQHQVGIRLQDEDGQWGLTANAGLYLRNIVAPSTQQNITEVEMFFGETANGWPGEAPSTFITYTTDYERNATFPEEGAATDVEVTEPNTSVTLTTTDDNNVLKLGFGRHYVYVRAKSEDGRWSLTSSSSIDVCKSEDAFANFSIENIGGKTVAVVDSSLNAIDHLYNFNARKKNSFVTKNDSTFEYVFSEGGEYAVVQKAGSQGCGFDLSDTLFVNISAPRVKKDTEGNNVTFSNRTFTEDDAGKQMTPTLDEIFEHPNGLSMTYEWVTKAYDSEGEVTASTNGISGNLEADGKTVYVKPNANVDRSGRGIIKATDVHGDTAYYIFSIPIIAVNDAPYLRNNKTIPDEHIMVNGTSTLLLEDLNNYFADIERDSISYSATSDQAGVTAEVRLESETIFGDQTFNFYLHADPDFTGNAQVTFIASDVLNKGANAQEFIQTIDVLVTRKEFPPQKAKTFPQFFTVNDGYNAQLIGNLNTYFTDKNDDVLYYEVISDRAEIKLSIKNANELWLEVPYDFDGTSLATLTVRDREDPDDILVSTLSQNFEVFVDKRSDELSPEFLNNFPNIQLDFEETYVLEDLDTYFKDGNGDLLYYSVTNNNNDLSVNLSSRDTQTNQVSLEISSNNSFTEDAEITLTARDRTTEEDARAVNGVLGVVALNKVTGTEDEQALGFSFFPNPLSSGMKIHLRMDNPMVGNVTIQWSDNLGKPIFTDQLWKSSTDFAYDWEIPRLPAGVYYLKIQMEEYMIIEKIVIQ